MMNLPEEYCRRIQTGTFSFSLFSRQRYLRPTVTNLPNILMEINTDQKLGITDALNLDGGSASFLKGKIIHRRINNCRRVFCIRGKLIFNKS